MFTLPDDNIVGGVVRRRFTVGGSSREAGTELTKEEICSIPIANRNALVENHFIEIFRMPKPKGTVERVVVATDSKSSRRFYVVEGVRINPALLSSEEAEALASEDLTSH